MEATEQDENKAMATEEKKDKPAANASDASKGDSEERGSSAERKKNNPYISSSSASQSEDEAAPAVPAPVPVPRLKFSRSRSRSRSRSHSEKRGEKGKEEVRRKSASKDKEEPRPHPYSRGNRRSPYHRTHSPGTTSRHPHVVRPGLNGPLLSYKHFMELQRDPIDMQDAEQLYATYKKLHTDKQNEIFFNMHKEDHWFKEKYHPEQSYQWQMEKRVQAQLLAKRFFEQLKKNTYQGVRLEAPADEAVFKQAEGSGKLDITKPPYYGFDPNSVTLYLRALPVTISRWEVLAEVKHTPGFLSLSLSEPLKTQDFVRYAWVSYDSEENCAKSRLLLENTAIGNFKLSPIKSQSAKKPVRITPPLTQGREIVDLDLSRKLILLLDEEKQIKDNELTQSPTITDPILQLDLQLLYLRKVHALCYYSAEEYDDERMLAAKCGPVYLRSSVRISPTQLNEYMNTKIFEERVTSHVNSRLAKGPSKLVKPGEGNEEVEELKNAFYTVNIVKIGENKYSCGICEKPFMGEQYVRKHLDAKHSDKLFDDKFKRCLERQMYKNYCNDENRFINQPSSISTITVPQGTRGRRGYGYDRERESRYEERRKAKQEKYVDWDEPQQTRPGPAAPTGEAARGLISYDDLQL